MSFWETHYEDRGEFESDLLIEGVVDDPYEPVPLELAAADCERAEQWHE